MSNINVFEQHGAFSWCELMADDVDAALSFYKDVIGWEVESTEMVQGGTYYTLKAAGHPVAGIMAKPPEAAGVPAHWGAYITVDSVDETLAKAEAAGGKVIAQPMQIPEVGRMAVIADNNGAAVAVITYDQKEG